MINVNTYSGTARLPRGRKKKMRQKWLVGLAAALALVVLPKATFAQVRSEPGGAPESAKSEAKDWEKLMERIRPIYLKRLQEELKLDQAAVDKVAKSYDSYRGQKRDLHKERNTLVVKLREAVEQNASEGEIEAILDQYDDYSDRRHQVTTSSQAEMRQILGARSYAEYVLFRQKFRRDIWNTLREIKKKKEG
jgi:Spy/CpxP family protein refolding chaperone